MFQVIPGRDWCFSPSAHSNCISTDFSVIPDAHRDKQELPSGQAIMFSLQPNFKDLDMRLRVDVTYGEIDVYLASHPKAITIQ